MKKLKWLLLLLVACCCIGCGKGEEAAKTGNDMVEESGEDTSKDKDKEEEEEDKDDKGGKNEKQEESEPGDKEELKPTATLTPKPTATPVEKQPVPYAVTQSNKFEIEGTWYDASGKWELIIHVGAGNEFPNIAEVVLTDGDLNAAFFLDENHRESDNVIYSCFFDGSRMNPKVTFTEDGIILEYQDVLTGKVLFTRPEGYVKGAQVAGHAVTQENLSDIMGNWYDQNNQWNFFILPCNDGQFPNVGRGVLTNGVQNILLCMDERGRKSDSVIQTCDEKGKLYNTLVTFTEDGIKVDGIPSEGFNETVFVRDGLYSGAPVGTTNYYNLEDVAYQVIHQMPGNGKTYYLLQGAYDGSLAVCYENGVNYTSYEGDYMVAEAAVCYYDQMLMGFPVVRLIDSAVYTEAEFEQYGAASGGDWGEFVDRTDEFEFDYWFDGAYYNETLDLWIVTNTSRHGKPFEMTGIDILAWEDNVLQFVGNIKNTGTEKYIVGCEIRLYDEDGWWEYDEYQTLLADLSDDYYIDPRDNGRIQGLESLAIDPGEEGKVTFMDKERGCLMGVIDTSEFEGDDGENIRCIYIKVDEYAKWIPEADGVLDNLYEIELLDLELIE